MTPEQKRGHAKELLANQVLMDLVDTMIEDAVFALAYAPPESHDLRQIKAAEIRSFHDLQARLAAMAKEPDAPRVKSIA